MYNGIVLKEKYLGTLQCPCSVMMLKMIQARLYQKSDINSLDCQDEPRKEGKYMLEQKYSWFD